mmetsp:Transcript_1950/g.3700  ORF Transcript_1950/g.3700 Transcript_1950/m.3700 type:complete len:100 (-) Transcript_1950:1023-1322(-)
MQPIHACAEYMYTYANAYDEVVVVVSLFRGWVQKRFSLPRASQILMALASAHQWQQVPVQQQPPPDVPLGLGLPSQHLKARRSKFIWGHAKALLSRTRM